MSARSSHRSVSRLAVAAAFAALACASVALAETVTLPAAASIVGGAPFYSDVRVFNTSYTDTLSVTATYRCFIGAPCPPFAPLAAFTLAPRDARAFDNMVALTFFAPDTAGGVEFQHDGDPKQLVVTSRLYSTEPTPTVGMFIPGLHDSDAHASTVLTSIRNGGDGAGFRTNVGVFNPSGAAVSVTFTIADAFGSQRGQPVSLPVAGHSGLQVSGIFGAAGVAGFQTDNAVILVSASGPVFSYAAVIDNATTDPIFVVGASDGPVLTPTDGPSPTRTATGSGPVFTFTPTLPGSTFTPSSTPSRTQSPTPGTPTNTFTPSQTFTPFTPTVTLTPTRTLSPTTTFTPSRTFTQSETPTVSPTLTPTLTFTSTRTFTNSPTFSRTPTGSVTASPTASATASRTPTRTVSVTASPTRTVTPNLNRIVNVGQGGMNFRDTVSGTSTSTITVGTTIQWNWVASTHSTTSGTCSASNCVPDFLWNSGVQPNGATFERTFNTVGTFTYYCTIHTVNMQGLVNVLPAPAPAR